MAAGSNLDDDKHTGEWESLGEELERLKANVKATLLTPTHGESPVTPTTEKSIQCIEAAESLPPEILEKELGAARIVDIVDHGDMLLLIESDDGSGTAFKVASQVLCAASKVFLAMLGPDSNFQEALSLRKTKTPRASSALYIQVLEDDDTAALEIVLNVIHLCNNRVPETIEFSTLVQVCVVCDKYDMTEAMRWVKPTWIEKWEPLALEPGYEAWLLVAWIFERSESFEKLSKKFILESSMQVNGGLKMDTGDYMLENLPQSVTDAIRNARQETIDKLLRANYDVLDRYSDFDKIKEAPICSMDFDKKFCDTTCLGYILRNMHEARLHPKADTVSRRLSCAVVLKRIDQYTQIIFYGHEACLFYTPLKKICKATYDSVNGLHSEDFVSHRKLPYLKSLPYLVSEKQ